MTDSSQAEREARERAEPPFTNTSLQRPAFHAGWTAHRSFAEKRHIEQQAGPIEALADLRGALEELLERPVPRGGINGLFYRKGIRAALEALRTGRNG